MTNRTDTGRLEPAINHLEGDRLRHSHEFVALPKYAISTGNPRKVRRAADTVQRSGRN